MGMPLASGDRSKMSEGNSGRGMTYVGSRKVMDGSLGQLLIQPLIHCSPFACRSDRAEDVPWRSTREETFAEGGRSGR
jgi:hypothetical protein